MKTRSNRALQITTTTSGLKRLSQTRSELMHQVE